MPIDSVCMFGFDFFSLSKSFFVFVNCVLIKSMFSVGDPIVMSPCSCKFFISDIFVASSCISKNSGLIPFFVCSCAIFTSMSTISFLPSFCASLFSS